MREPLGARRRDAFRVVGLAAVLAVAADSAGLAAAQSGPEGDAAPAPSVPAETPPALSFRYGDGVRLRAGAFRGRVRTRLHLDFVDPSFDDTLGDDEAAIAPDYDDGRGLRRARWLGDFGFDDESPYAPFSARLQVDFSGSQIDWKDAYARATFDAAVGSITEVDLRAGQFREAFGLEAMTSVTHLAFIERSPATNTFTPGRSRGLQGRLRGEDWSLSVGHFRRAEGLPFPDDLGTETATTVRALHQRQGALAQVGASVSLREPGDDGIRLSARPGTRLLNRVVDTGTVDAERAVTFGTEALWRLGEVTAWAEVFGAHLEDVDGAGDAWLSGGHVAVSWFPWVGRTTWNRGKGGMGPPDVPDVLSTRANGDGAVELVARASWTDLDDGPLAGGQLQDLEIGANWYLQRSTRVMLHWLVAHVDGDATEHALLGRIQIEL